MENEKDVIIQIAKTLKKIDLGFDDSDSDFKEPIRVRQT